MAQGNGPLSRRETYDASLSGANDRPLIPRLRSDPLPHGLPHTLQEFRDSEGRENRKNRLQALWRRLFVLPHPDHQSQRNTSNTTVDPDRFTRENAESLKTMYENELLGHCKGHPSAPGQVGWKEFKEYAQAKEVGESNLEFILLFVLTTPQNCGPSSTTNLIWMATDTWMPKNSH
jgi:solute carrier family 25 phosphate transporter 23/24/25/41